MLSLGILNKTKKYIYLQNDLPYSADGKPTQNKTGLILSSECNCL